MCLLEEDIVEDPRDVNVDIVLHRLEHVHVGLHRVEQLAGLGYLTRLRAVSTIGIWSTSMGFFNKFVCLRGRWFPSPSLRFFLLYYTMILQRIRSVVGDAEFEVWCATNEPPHLQQDQCYHDLIDTGIK